MFQYKSIILLVITLICLIMILDTKYIGEAIQQNPGFLKLRKIQAAQKIAKTVSKLCN